MTYEEWISRKLAELRERLQVPEAQTASMVPETGRCYPCATGKRFSQLYIPPEGQERNA